MELIKLAFSKGIRLTFVHPELLQTTNVALKHRFSVFFLGAAIAQSLRVTNNGKIAILSSTLETRCFYFEILHISAVVLNRDPIPLDRLRDAGGYRVRFRRPG